MHLVPTTLLIVGLLSAVSGKVVLPRDYGEPLRIDLHKRMGSGQSNVPQHGSPHESSGDHSSEQPANLNGGQAQNGQSQPSTGRTSHQLLLEMINHQHRKRIQQLNGLQRQHNIQGPPPPFNMIRQSPQQSPLRTRPANDFPKKSNHPK